MDQFKRFRNRRIDEPTRERFRESSLCVQDFILPLFILEGDGRVEDILTMPGVARRSIDKTVDYLKPLVDRGLESVLLFGIPDKKGVAQATSDNGIVQRAVRVLKRHLPSLEIITDVCICSYSQDGHCHIGDNDRTARLLAAIAVSHAEAGADVVAPSDMMDGRVWYMKRALDAAGLSTPILSYAAKYASSFYGPFRDAADCAPQNGDRRGYQMDPANGDEALEEIAADFEEGAEAIIVKPAMTYLDIVRRAREAYPDREIVVYNVSGEYASILSAISQKLLPEGALDELLLSFKRAGASRIITYAAAQWLQR